MRQSLSTDRVRREGRAGLLSRLAGVANWRRAAMAIAAGAGSALAMPPFYLLPLLIAGLTALVVLLDEAADRSASRWQAVRRSALSGWWYGFGFFLVGLYWIGFAFLVDADAFAWMIPFVAVLVPAGLGLFFAGAAAAAQLFWSRGVERIAVLALAWLAFEWLRGHVLTGFPWNLAAYVWMVSPEISQSLALVGAYGLSLVTVLVCASPAAFVGDRGSVKGGMATVLASVVVVAVMWGAGAERRAANPIDLADGVELRLVQPSIPQAEKWLATNRNAVFQRFLDLTAGPGYDRVTHVVWPEAAVPYFLSREPERLAAIGRLLGPDRTLIVGAVRYEFVADREEPNYFNALHVIIGGTRLEGEIVATYDKHHLVPFGEYLPLAGVLSRLGLRQLAQGAGAYSSGPGLMTLPVPGAPPASPLICYEIIFPGTVTAPDERPGWIVNLTNDAWFGDSSGPRQHLAMARARAIETGLPVVRAANNGISAVIDPLGGVMRRLPLNETGVVDAALPNALAPTWYSRIGDGAVLPLVLFLVFGVVTTRRIRSLD